MVIKVTNPREVIRIISKIASDPGCHVSEQYHHRPDVERICQTWAGFVEHGMGSCYVLDNEGGFLLGLFMPCIITGIPQALEFLWVVLPQYQGKGVAVQLLEAFESEARERGCHQVLVGNSEFLRPAVMRRFYRRRGYVPHAEAFRLDLVKRECFHFSNLQPLWAKENVSKGSRWNPINQAPAVVGERNQAPGNFDLNKS
jgi:GNAT superfamily N-acetyltransferase